MTADPYGLCEDVGRLVIAPEALQSVPEIVIDRRVDRAARHHLLEQGDGVLPAALAQQHEARVERREVVARAQLVHAPELAHGFVEHPRLVERDAEIAVFGDARLRRHGFDGLVRPTR